MSVIRLVNMVRPVLHAVPQDVDRAALTDLALQPSEELTPCRAVLTEGERFGHFGLCRVQESPSSAFRSAREVWVHSRICA